MINLINNKCMNMLYEKNRNNLWLLPFMKMKNWAIKTISEMSTSQVR